MKKTLGLLSMALLAGCAPTVGLDAGPHASDPRCAEMLLATPDTIGGINRSKTTAQATTAWGKTTFRCGITPPAPSDDRCITVAGIDWLSLDASDPRVDATEGAWTLLSYGRTPAVEVVIPTEAVGDGIVTDVLAEFAPAMNLAQVDGHCLGTDVNP